MMPISRSELLKELLPGLNELFGMEYKTYAGKIHERNEQIHGATESEQRIIERGYQTPPENNTQGSNI
jgi:hypothetical protein